MFTKKYNIGNIELANQNSAFRVPFQFSPSFYYFKLLLKSLIIISQRYLLFGLVLDFLQQFLRGFAGFRVFAHAGQFLRVRIGSRFVGRLSSPAAAAETFAGNLRVGARQRTRMTSAISISCREIKGQGDDDTLGMS